MPTSPLVEQRVVAFALGHPGFGPARIAAELARPKWGGIVLSTNGVWRVLRRHGLSTRAKRYGLVAGYAAPPEPAAARSRRPSGTWTSTTPVSWSSSTASASAGCQGTKGTVWQYTAIDVASAYTWATLQVTRRNPSATWTSQLARTVAADLAERGWKLERVMSDNASEFRSAVFGQTVATLGARHSFIRAGRPQTNGCVERVQQTILEECWKPAFARYLIPKQTGLRLDLERYLRYYNTERAHTGRWTKGRTPEEVLGKAKLWHKKR